MSVKSALVILAVLLLTTAACAAPTYEGWLYWLGADGVPAANSEIVATANWQSTATYLHWQVTEQSDGYLYWYQWSAPAKDLSHIVIEVSQNATSADFWGKELDCGTKFVGPANYSVKNGNPLLPQSIVGIKIDDVSAKTTTFSFMSSRVPVWGNFYAKDGKTGGADVVAWNAGFVGEGGTYDSQYNTELSAVNLQSDLFIARPDSRRVPGPQVPEWGSLALGVLALPSIVAWRRARR